MIRNRLMKPTEDQNTTIHATPIVALNKRQRGAIMPNRTISRPNTGLSALAKAEWLAKQKAAEKLAAARAEQIAVAVNFAFFQKGRKPLKVQDLDANDPKRTIFEATLAAFSTAQAEKDRGGKTTKGAIRVAAELASDQHKMLFQDEATSNAAMIGSKWAQEALKWAGSKIFRKEETKPKPAAPKVEQVAVVETPKVEATVVAEPNADLEKRMAEALGKPSSRRRKQ